MILESIFLLGVTGLVAMCVYNRFFHPLADFPGPFWGSIVDLYMPISLLLAGGEHVVDAYLHEKYGPVFRKGPNTLIVNDPLLLPMIYNRHSHRPSRLYTPAMFGAYHTPAVVNQLTPSTHNAARRIVQPPFTSTAVKAYRPFITACVAQWTSLLSSYAQRGQVVDWCKTTQCLAYDVISGLVFGEPIGFSEKGEDKYSLLAQVSKSFPIIGPLSRMPWLVEGIVKIPLLRDWILPTPWDKSGLGRLMGVRDELLQQRVDMGSAGAKKDILAHLLDAKDADGNPLPQEKVRAETLFLLAAGSETTVSTMCGFILNLHHHPHVYKKLLSTGVEETYLTAVIKETLRYTHPIPNFFPRIISTPINLASGLVIPVGTEVSMNAYCIGRDTGVFGDDAGVFRPERWLEEKEKVARMDGFNNIWGFGPTVCLGRPVAEMELAIAMKELLLNFEIEFVDPDKPCAKITNHAALCYKGMFVKIHNREGTLA